MDRMTFIEWVDQRYGAAAAQVPKMQQLEAWDAGRQDLRLELEPLATLATDIAQVLENAFANDNWSGVPETLARARALGALPPRGKTG